MIPVYALQAMHSPILYESVLPRVFLSSGGSTAGSLSNILSSATELLTWFITSMGALLTFITSNPLILMMFLILMVGSVVGMLFRVWHSA